MTCSIEIKYRTATGEDVSAVRELVRAAYQRWVPVIGREPRPMVADYEKAVCERHVDLALLDERVAGLIETVLRDDHLWIENVAVHPERQGKGLGKALLAYAETKARQAGRPEIRLLTNAAFETNVALYKRTGYLITASEPFMGGTTIYMTKRVNP